MGVVTLGVLVAFILMTFAWSNHYADAKAEYTAEELEAHHEYKDLLYTLSTLGDKDQVASKSRLLTFSYSNCGDPKEENAILSNVQVNPDPIKLPGNVSVAANLLIKEPFGSPVKIALTVKRKVMGAWVQVLSRNYPDACSFAKNVTCPPIFDQLRLSCKCPFTESGNWTLPPTTIPITNKIPWSGNYKLKATATYGGGKVLTCVEFVVSLAKARLPKRTQKDSIQELISTFNLYC